MSKISIEEVKKLARLCKVDLSDEQAHAFRDEFDEILSYIEQLNSVDTTGLEPTSQVTGLENVNRADVEIDYGVSPQDLLKSSPDSTDGYIKVPRVLQ